MFKNRAYNGKLNLCGVEVAALRTKMKISQRALADMLQLSGLDLGKNAVQQIESGSRFVTDIELAAFSKILKVSCDHLVKSCVDKKTKA